MAACFKVPLVLLAMALLAIFPVLAHATSGTGSSFSRRRSAQGGGKRRDSASAPAPSPEESAADPEVCTTQPSLETGDESDEVTQLQTLLNTRAGANLVADGVLGTITVTVFVTFQQENGLDVDFTVGSATWEALCGAPETLSSAPEPPVDTEVCATRPELQEGAQGDDVVELQSLLNAVSGAELLIDGDYGPVTAGVVTDFQRIMGLDQDGIVGTYTWEALCPDGGH